MSNIAEYWIGKDIDYANDILIVAEEKIKYLSKSNK